MRTNTSVKKPKQDQYVDNLTMENIAIDLNKCQKLTNLSRTL